MKLTVPIRWSNSGAVRPALAVLGGIKAVSPTRRSPANGTGQPVSQSINDLDQGARVARRGIPSPIQLPDADWHYENGT